MIDEILEQLYLIQAQVILEREKGVGGRDVRSYEQDRTFDGIFDAILWRKEDLIKRGN